VVVHDGAADQATLDRQCGDLRIRPDVGAIVVRGREEAQRQPHRVDRPVRDPHRRLELRVEIRLQSQRVGGRRRLRRNPAGGAALQERLEIVEVFLGHGDEQSVIELERPRADPPEHPILLDALARGVAVVNGVAAAAVQQAVMAPGRSRGELSSLDERHTDPA